MWHEMATIEKLSNLLKNFVFFIRPAVPYFQADPFIEYLESLKVAAPMPTETQSRDL